ncbi:MAG: hypothetical protein HY700_09815 [Gemmatimonadetes bacterium]|nr:hypothetical protein [Gemmatimonadota bacterium]
MRYPILLLGLLATAGCTKTEMRAPPAPVAPFPGDLLTGRIAVYPLNNMSVDSTLGWNEALADRAQVRGRVDSMLVAVLNDRFSQVLWVTPAALRLAAAQAPGRLTEPDRMPTLLLQTHALTTIADPLASQMRELTAVAAGGRFALVPANLWFARDRQGRGTANLVVALADIRLRAVGWSATLSGAGDTPWEALDAALRKLTAMERR